MSERFTINKGEQVFNVYEAIDSVEACGKNGQVKGASCFGRTITLGGQELNRGSAIDFLREQVLVYNTEHVDAQLDLPEKGWFFGFCGTSTEDIENIFNILYPEISAPEEPPEIDLDTLTSEADAAKNAGDLDKAADLYLQAAHRGDDYARYNIGVFYEDGKGVNKDVNKALNYYNEITSDAYVSFAQYSMGRIYETGDDVDIDIDRALEHYINSAKCGSNDASNASEIRIQAIYTPEEIERKGKEYLRTENQARGWNFLNYRVQALPSTSYGNIVMGNNYLVEKRYQEALAEYTLGAELGSHRGWYLKGELLETVEEIQDIQEARHCYEKAVELGNRPAAQALARLNAATD